MLTAFVGLAAAGCQTPPGGGPAGRALQDLEPNVIKIVTFWGQSPFGPVGGGSKPGGFVIGALYLVAPTEKGGERGVFGDGIIHVYMYVLEKAADGKTVNRRLAKEWLYTPEQALPYRTKRPFLGGYGYQLHCAWGDADVLGKRIEIEVRFERKDGRVITGRPKQYIVPTG